MLEHSAPLMPHSCRTREKRAEPSQTLAECGRRGRSPWTVPARDDWPARPHQRQREDAAAFSTAFLSVSHASGRSPSRISTIARAEEHVPCRDTVAKRKQLAKERYLRMAPRVNEQRRSWSYAKFLFASETTGRLDDSAARNWSKQSGALSSISAPRLTERPALCVRRAGIQAAFPPRMTARRDDMQTFAAVRALPPKIWWSQSSVWRAFLLLIMHPRGPLSIEETHYHQQVA